MRESGYTDTRKGRENQLVRVGIEGTQRDGVAWELGNDQVVVVGFA